MESPSVPPQAADSPAQELFAEARRHVDAENRDIDSPSRQLLFEFSRMLIDSDRKFHDQLDQATAEQEKVHLEALAKAAAEHERVRQSAERVAEKFRLEVERERRRREEESQREVERLRQENARIEAAEHQRKLDELRRAEEEQRKVAERAMALAEAEERLRAQKAADEVEAAKRKAEQAERDREAKEAAEAAAKAQAAEAVKPPPAAAAAPAPIATSTTNNFANGTASAIAAKPKAAVTTTTQINSPLVTPQVEKEAIHKEYVDLHQRLKKFRSTFVKEARANPALKEMSSDMRRQIRTKVGQLTLDPKANRGPLGTIRQIFYKAIETPGLPMIDAREYMAPHTRTLIPDANAQAPALLIFLFNHFAKSIVAQFANEAGVNPKAADPIGIIAVSIFGDRKLCIGPDRNVPFSDILLAKYHVSCGVLFGIYGPENTARGRQRLGWRQLDGAWVSEQANLERMTGLGAGWAALTLRNFRGKEALLHPFPNAHFWRAFSRIVNTPPPNATTAHFVVLKAMLENKSVDKFVQNYGAAAVAALRKGLLEFPRGSESTAAKALGVMAQTIREEFMLAL